MSCIYCIICVYTVPVKSLETLKCYVFERSLCMYFYGIKYICMAVAKGFIKYAHLPIYLKTLNHSCISLKCLFIAIKQRLRVIIGTNCVLTPCRTWLIKSGLSRFYLDVWSPCLNRQIIQERDC